MIFIKIAGFGMKHVSNVINHLNIFYSTVYARQYTATFSHLTKIKCTPEGRTKLCKVILIIIQYCLNLRFYIIAGFGKKNSTYEIDYRKNEICMF